MIYISCTKNDQLPPESRKTDNVTSKWPRAGGATMSRAQTGHIIISNTQYTVRVNENNDLILCEVNFAQFLELYA